jgi:hypothetical protein
MIKLDGRIGAAILSAILSAVLAAGAVFGIAGPAQAVACSPACFYYAANRQVFSPAIDGAQVSTRVYTPNIHPTKDAHSLFELAVDGPGGSAVEVGWTVENGSAEVPHLFVFNWDGTTPGCYNGCGWHDNAAVALNAGDSLATFGNATHDIRFAIQHTGGVWWVNASTPTTTQWIGYFPDSDWVNSPMTGVSTVQAFGEIASFEQGPPVNTCADMANGSNPTVNPASSAGQVWGYGLLGSTGGQTAGFSNILMTDSAHWGVTAISATAFAYGGPGNPGMC